MEPNITPGASPELNTASTPAEPAKKSKGLLAATIIFASLAIAGIGFGVYGMFFQPKPTCETNCASNTDNQSADNQSETAPTIAEVSELLKEKYGFDAIENTFSDDLFRHMNNFDQAAKIHFTIRNSNNILSEPNYPSTDPYFTREVSYDALNSQYQYYFGNTDNIKKEDYEIESLGISKIVYLSEKDAFEVYYRDGIGGYSTIEQINKVVDTYSTRDGFMATIISVNVDSSPKGSAAYWGSDGVTEHYSINLSEDDLDDIAESLSAYKFGFIKEDGEYKLVSIEKLWIAQH